MTDQELRAAWVEIRRRAEEAWTKYQNDMDHHLCCWGWGDATEHKEAWNYIETVLNADSPPS